MATDSDDINDFGEKIGGARKDRAVKTGPKAKPDQPVDNRPGWAKRFVAAEKLQGGKPTGKWTLLDTRRTGRFGSAAATRVEFGSRAEAERAVPLIAVSQKHRVTENYGRGPDGKIDTSKSTFEIWRSVSDKKRVKAVPQTFESREAASRYMAENAERMLGTARGYGEEILAKPDKVVRTGASWRKGDVKPEQFKEFGFRGVEFGHWQGDRQQVMNHAYDAMRDLADITGVAPESLTFKERLALAFGARGNGGKIAARAHYEQAKAAINLTKEAGAGTLAHEWWHAVDHHLAQIDDPKLGVMQTDTDGTKRLPAAKGMETALYASQRVAGAGQGQLNEAVRTAYKDLMDTMLRKPEQVTVEAARYEKASQSARENLERQVKALREDIAKPAPYGKRFVAPASAEQLAKFDKIAENILSGKDLETKHVWNNTGKSINARGGMAGRWTNPSLDALSEVYKEVRGRSGFDSQNQHGVMDRLRGAMSSLKSASDQLKSAVESPTKTVMTATEFARNARKLDEARTTPYWQTRHELAARAFSAFIEDKLAAANRQSTYLSYGSDNTLYKVFDQASPFPEGAERQAINAKFDKLFEAMRATDVVRPASSLGMRAAPSAGADVQSAIRAASAQQVQEPTGKPAGWSDEARAASAQARKTEPEPAKAKPRAAVIGDNGGPSDRAVKAAAKLEAVAKRTAETAEKVANQPRQMNTPRRARMGSGVIDEANAQKAHAETALKIANALRNGEAGNLSNVKSLADVRALSSLYRNAMHEADRVLKRPYEPGKTPTMADIEHARMPSAFIRATGSDIESFKKVLPKGYARDLAILAKHSEAAERGRTFGTTDSKVIEATKRVAKAVSEKGDRHTKWAANKFLDEIRDYDRVKSLGIDSREKLKAVLTDYANARVAKPGADPIKAAERALIGVKMPGYFPTPESLAKRMADLADIRAGQTVLEPSAGSGRLADVAKARGASVDTVEMQSRLRDLLTKKGHNLIDSDFTEMKPEAKYDRILMNPPFENRADAEHVRRAYDHLKPGGKMVAIMGEGVFFGSDKKATEFRNWLDAAGGTSEKLPEGTFKESNTGVNTRLVVIEKPGPAASAQAVQAAMKATPSNAKPVDPPYISPAEINERYKQAYGDRAAIGATAPGSTAMSEANRAAEQKAAAAPKTKDPGVMSAVDRAIARSNEMAAKAKPQLLPQVSAELSPTSTVKMMGIPADGGKPFLMAILDSAGDKKAIAERTWNQTAKFYTQPLAGYRIEDKSGNRLHGFQDEAILNAALKAQGSAEKGKAKPPATAPAQPAQEVRKSGKRFEVLDNGKPILDSKGKPKWFGTQEKAEKFLSGRVGKAFNKLGAVSMIAAPVTAAILAYDAKKSEAQAAGASSSSATGSAVAAGAVAGTTTAAVGYGIAKGMTWAVRGAVAAGAAVGAPVIGTAAVVGVTALGVGMMAKGAYDGYQKHGVKGAVLGSVGAEGLLDRKPAAPPVAAPVRLSDSQRTQFATANATYNAMKQVPAIDVGVSTGGRGFANLTVQRAAQQARGRTYDPSRKINAHG